MTDKLIGTITPRAPITGGIAPRGDLTGTVSVAQGVRYPEYEGAYEADARFSEQTFATAQKVMRDDFTVHAINYTEAPNESGITVTIGG